MTRRGADRTLPPRSPAVAARGVSPAIERKALLVILALAATAQVVLLLQLHDHVLLQPDGGTDSAHYVQLARDLIAGDTAPGHAFFVAPLYVYFLAGGLAVLRSELGVRVLQIVLGTAAIWLIHRTAREWFGPRAALIAAGLAAGTGLFTFNEVLLLHAALDPFLTALALYAITRAAIGRDWRLFAAAGLAIGLHALNRPNVAAYAVVVFAGVLLTQRTREGIRHAAAFACGVSLALAPVAVRNYARTGEIVLISSHGGLNFYIGNNPDADGTYRAVPGIAASIAGQAGDAQQIASRALGHAAGEAETSRYFYHRAADWMLHHPGQAARLWLTKAVYVLNSAELALDYSYAFYQRDETVLLRVLGVGAWLLIPVGVVGLLAPRRQGRAGYWLWAAFVPVYALSVMAFFVSSRYRMPLLIPLTAGAGAAIDRGIELCRRRDLRRLVAAAAGVAGLAMVTNHGAGLDEGRWEERTALVVALIDRGRIAKAEEAIGRFEATQPEPALLHGRAAQALQQQGRNDAAIAHLEKALSRDPAQPVIDFALGRALVAAGRNAEAIPHLRRAYDARIRPDVTGVDLARALAAEGLAHAVAGDTRTALEELEQAVRLDPAAPASHLNLAVMYARSGRTAEAVAAAREALRLRPDYSQAEGLLRELGSR
jgi:tetratricopeptide (TPR) repeat protein